MLRPVLSAVCVLALCVVFATAADDKDNKDKNAKDKATKKDKNSKNQRQAKITKVDAKKGTVTVQMKDKDGKETTRTFTLAEDAEYLDSTGRVARVDVFTSGDYVLIVEAEGKIKQMKKQDKGKSGKDRSDKKDK